MERTGDDEKDFFSAAAAGDVATVLELVDEGVDLPMALMDGEGQFTLLTPIITALENPDCSSYLRQCFQ